MVFNGDDHHYRHSLRNGIHSVVTGGGGAPLHDLGTAMSEATLIYAEKNYQHCVIDVAPESLVFYSSRTDGTVMDSFSLAWPTAVSLSFTALREHQPPGTTVGTLATVDPNSGDTFTYSLVGGAGSEDNAAFTISGDTLLTAASFDYETKNTYSIRVRSMDQGGLTYETILTVTVTDADARTSAHTKSD